ncbi:helix-turn-helix domain-containing protein [Bacteroides heparinolyticus]|uniref:AraC family transcriptional regulator n=5 Tax=Prevotella heparinolytica TaxID=28113 RepID=UPI0035A1A2C0
MLDNKPLLILQSGSLTVSALLALILLMSHIHQRQTSRNYETSRRLLFTSMLIYTIHYALQIRFGFRAHGEDLGSLINILFYSPTVYLISYSSLCMAGIRQCKKTFFQICITSILLLLICFIMGWLTYGSLHMPYALYAMGAIFVISTLVLIIYPVRKIGNARRKVEDETGGDISLYNLYMHTATVMLYAIAALMPFVIFSTTALVFLGPVYFLILTFYILSFVALGFNIAPIGNVIDEKSDVDADFPAETDYENMVAFQLSDEQKLSISSPLTQWQEARGYSAPNINSTTLALQLNVPKHLLVQYLREQEGKTFRVWLSDLRIEEAKRILIEHPNYDNESIATACGFASRTWLQNRFKAVTGMTPAEWRKKQSHKKNT